MHNETIMVTGAGGSIGSELCRHLVSIGVGRLIAVDISEYNLYRLEQSLTALNGPTKIKYLLGDVRHEFLVQAIVLEQKPTRVFHAAALKHVPMLEYGHNTLEAIRTNVLGTKYVLDACIRHRVKQFLFVSTDKAVEPLSVMGASKSFAEGYCEEASRYVGETTKIAVVRFGNVIGSSGSVIPLFQEQIAAGGPVTVTHPEMARYFMTIPEAVALVVEASEMNGSAPFPYSLYILQMGEEILITDLVHRLIDEAGKQRKDIAIKFTGLRPGEKLHERLYWPHEQPVPTQHPRVMQLLRWEARKGFVDGASQLALGCEYRDAKRVKELIRDYVGYTGDMEILE